MTNGTKVGVFISGAAVLGLAAYFTYIQLSAFKKKRDAELASQSTAISPTIQPIKTVTAPTITTPKPPVVVTPPRTGTGFATPSTSPTMGSDVYAGATGANAYKTASASATNIYKYYSAGSYIGTYLAKDGIYTKVIVTEKGIFSDSNVTVWVLTSNIKS